jgi:hypothetical protein
MQLLEESGIESRVVLDRGYRTVRTKAELKHLGFSGQQQRAPALVIPMYSPTGELVSHQIKPDCPRTDAEGKKIKYETPTNSPVRLDVHPSQTERIKDPTVPLWVTEGVKKGDCLVSHGQCAVSLQGVWSWQKDGAALAEWEDFRLHRRLVYVVFDSDVIIKSGVQSALRRLVCFLRLRGAVVKVVYLPDKQNGGKQGVDDYLATGGTIQELMAYAEDDLRDTPGEVGTLLSEVEPEQVEWLWDGRIPLGKLTILDGDPGLGKSVITMDLAARVTTGRGFPNGDVSALDGVGGVGGVVILSAEDGIADTIRPRLDAAGADTTKIVAMSTVPDSDGNERTMSIPEDIVAVEKAIRRVDAKLVIVDPLMAFLSGKANYDQDVRKTLTPLARMAERTGAAVLVVRHLNKNPGGKAIYRGGSSIGIIGAARSGLVIEEHPNKDLRVLAVSKSNLAKKAASLTYSITTADNGTAKVAWGAVTNLNADDILHPDMSELAKAMAWLRELLEDGPMPQEVVKAKAKDEGVAWRTLERAKSKLGVKSEKSGKQWTWHLPSNEGCHLREGRQDSRNLQLAAVG